MKKLNVRVKPVSECSKSSEWDLLDSACLSGMRLRILSRIADEHETITCGADFGLEEFLFFLSSSIAAESDFLFSLDDD